MSAPNHGQNRSTAVMQQRLRDDVPDPLDYFPTPPWATRALCEWLAGEHDTRKRWIRPGTRRLLEREGDYPDYSHLFTAKEGTLL